MSGLNGRLAKLEQVVAERGGIHITDWLRDPTGEPCRCPACRPFVEALEAFGRGATPSHADVDALIIYD